MSWIDSLVDVGSSVWNFFTGSSTASTLARTVASGYALKQITDSINKDNAAADTAQKPDQGVREQVDPDTANGIPIVYGTAFVGGRVTDAVLTNDNQTMWYCLALCEKTGTKLSDSQASSISFLDVYWNQMRIVFQSDGITAASFVDEDGVTTDTPNGLIKVYPFSGNSTSPVLIRNYSSGNTQPAYSLFPNWTSNHSMSDLIFVLIRVDYNKEKNITGIGNMEFHLRNSMSLPGDCLHDYMTNTRYGAGIAPEEINS